jgi:hypothetical protein
MGSRILHQAVRARIDGEMTRAKSMSVRVAEQRRSHAPDSNKHLTNNSTRHLGLASNTLQAHASFSVDVQE